ncbi:hypothetical protein D0Z00_003083 [Geotrichum galactomycetum]|uniref:Uncharacterized protein n=1 Tax=Geotrichum galactomycetum TaxID=27317 RepID=A0ACB6V267_9ASCO|nr:hypothetical protein D0Z00_003083 [Geotrichum candidum]
MPMPGDQHKESEVIFKDGWSKEEVNAIQNRLWKNLGPEFIAYRPAPGGGRVAYLEGWKAINLANDAFGFNGWKSEIKSLNIDYCDELSGGRFSIGISCVIRVTLKDGSFHEDVGFGHAENVKMKYVAFDKCKKEATTDGLKRALRKFGHDDPIFDDDDMDFDEPPAGKSPEIRRTLQHNKSVPIKRSDVGKTQPPPPGVILPPSSNFVSGANKTAPPAQNNPTNSNRSSPTPSAPTNTATSPNILNKPNMNVAPKFSNPPAKAFGAPRRPIARPIPPKRPMADLGKSQTNIPPVTEAPADKKQKVDE